MVSIMIRKIVAIFITFALVGAFLTVLNLTANSTPAKADGGGPSLDVSAMLPTGMAGAGFGTGGVSTGGGNHSGGGGSTGPTTFTITLACHAPGSTYQSGQSCSVRANYYAFGDTGTGGYKMLPCSPAADGRSAYSVYVVYSQSVAGSANSGATNIPVSYSCNYPQVASLQPYISSTTRCYYDYAGSYYYAATRGTISGSGSFMGNRSPNHEGGDPAAGAGCNTSNKTNFSAKAGDYGYYRIVASLKAKDRYQWSYPSWMNKPGYVTWSGAMAATAVNYYAYSCSIAGTFQGPTPNLGSLPGSVAINAGDCAQANWQCKPQGTLDINKTHGNVSLMRDGSNVPFTAPQMVISGSGVRGYSGQSKVADSDTSYLISVNSGSTPSNGTNQNDGKQYYKLLKSNGSSPESFGNWYSGANDNRSKFLNFYWSSDNGGTWSATRKVKFNAQFAVPRATTIGGPTSLQWVKGNASCADLKSNKATIVRSANG